jgi:hypothetical protein
MSDAPRIPDDLFPADEASGLSDAELRELLARAKETGDEPLRRLIASYITLRTLAAEMISFIETREGAITIVRTPLFGRIQQLTRRARG